ncbi:hypothetical protein B0H13DRAFT_1926507 [Mycena leptocephala]|nr:hypothetical protein B0H13DRAFT_1926507 [Mycena leptocephala]
MIGVSKHMVATAVEVTMLCQKAVSEYSAITAWNHVMKNDDKTSYPPTATIDFFLALPAMSTKKDLGKHLNKSWEEFHKLLINMEAAQADELEVLWVRLCTTKKKAEEEQTQKEEEQKHWEAEEKQWLEEQKKEAMKAKEKTEKKKRAWDRAVDSGESEVEGPKKKKAKVAENNPKCEKNRAPCILQTQPRNSCACKACAKAKKSPGPTANTRRSPQEIADSMSEYTITQGVQWEWINEEQDVHNAKYVSSHMVVT